MTLERVADAPAAAAVNHSQLGGVSQQRFIQRFVYSLERLFDGLAVHVEDAC